MKTHEEGSFAVMAAIRSPNFLLLIQNILDPSLFWKFIGETSKVGELPLHTLVRGVWEEGGLCIRAVYDELGVITDIGDSSLWVSSVRPPITLHNFLTGNFYEQYFYQIKMPDERLLDLSGKRFDGADKDELFETRAFPIRDVSYMKDFLPHHLSLFSELLRTA
ncbi:MAG: hypothetical protein NT019_02135 [Candidatus Adlerbacteria bacterium]|nr:hypothetical protein [Candidatus Adlerbacteria bacterium]